ncbi:MAG: hypothetical protein HY842_17915 [Bacteroidetes bacterium]|nr:hypothetical protein [Bacteroidota bacterium]
MLTNLFKKTGWFYLPCSIPGWVIFLVYVAVNVQFFTAIDRNSHSASDTLINFFPYFISLSAFYCWIAYHTARPVQPTVKS